MVGVKSGDTNFGTLGAAAGAATHAHPLSDAGQAKAVITSDVYVKYVPSAAYQSNFRAGVASGTASVTTLTFGLGLLGTTDSISSVPPSLALTPLIKT